jgi:5-methylcytosine-specific restriction endonuclease McrA
MRNRELARAAEARYRAKHRDELLARRAARQADNPDLVKAEHAQYYAEHRDEILAKHTEYRATHLTEERARHVRYYQAHKEAIATRHRAWRKANPERFRELTSQWRQEHPEYFTERNRLWNQENRERKRATWERRHARKLGAAGAEYTTVDHIMARWSMWGGRCWICGAPATETDHVKPLAKGGAHWPCNLRPVCSRCNRVKGDAWPYEKLTEKAP